MLIKPRQFQKRVEITQEVLDAMLLMTANEAKRTQDNMPDMAIAARQNAAAKIAMLRKFYKDLEYRDRVLTQIRRQGFTKMWVDDGYIQIETTPVVFEWKKTSFRRISRKETVEEVTSHVLYHAGPYVICIPITRDFRDDPINKHHFYRLEMPEVIRRHPHHEAYFSQETIPTRMDAHTCWGGVASYISPAFTDLDWTEYLRVLEVYVRSMNPRSFLCSSSLEYMRKERIV